MDSVQVCVNCHNNKTVNCTDNRLVTEACGHVKCMDCLITEKAGCAACASKDPENLEIPLDPIQTRLSLAYRDGDKDGEVAVYEKVVKKKKLETSHIKVQSDENGKCYTCVPCNKTFHARSQVAYHAYCNGQSKPYICPVPQCENKSFATHSHFEYHMRVHRNERLYSCDICGEGFFQMSKLQRHKLKHTKEKKFACTKCSKAFNNMTSLRKHTLTHTEERPYACADCGRRFRDGSNYKKHLEKHKEKKCTCSVCGRELGSRHALLSHVRASHERRVHACPQCPQSFRSGKDMRRHAAVHSDSKPFRCKVCKTQFRRKDNLERHIRNTHPDHVTSSAVEQIPDAIEPNTPDIPTEVKAKKELEMLNPLPPLPKELIQKHMEAKREDKKKLPEKDLEKSYIIQANNTRETVIVEKKAFERRSPSPECEYVHKIRKANTMSRNVALPPIDVEKVKKLHVTNLDIGAPPKDMQMERRLKNILLAPCLDKGLNE